MFDKPSVEYRDNHSSYSIIQAEMCMAVIVVNDVGEYSQARLVNFGIVVFLVEDDGIPFLTHSKQLLHSSISFP